MLADGAWLRDYVDGNRAIGFALLASVALHALFFFVLPGLRDSPQMAGMNHEPIMARLLRQEPKRAPAAAVPEARRPVQIPVPKPAPKVSARLPPKSEPEPLAPPRITPPVPTSTPAAGPVPAPAVAAALTAPSSPVASVPSKGDAAPSAPPPAEALDAGTLAQYRIALMSAARQFKRYPRAALDNSWQGRVEVRMAIAPSGAIAALTVRTSTGHGVLDQQALEMIERAKQVAPIPPALRGKEFTVDVPVIFTLKESGA